MSEEAKITVTIKAHGGYDAPWVVVRGDTPEEVGTLLDGIEGQGLYASVGNAFKAFQAQGLLGAQLGAKPVGSAPSAPAPAASTGGGNYAPAAGADVTLVVPFSDAAGREAVKAAGGRWNKDKKGWNVSNEVAAQFPQFKHV